MLRRFFYFALVIFSVSACTNSSGKFKSNTDNPFMVGKWIIRSSENSQANISKETYMLSLLDQSYEEGNILQFKQGDLFMISSPDGTLIVKGKYGLNDDNSVLSLLPNDQTEASDYKIVKNSDGTLELISKNAVEPMTLVISKEKE